MYFTSVADAVDNFAACLTQTREFAQTGNPLNAFPPKCGAAIADTKKLVDALLFVTPSERALRAVADALLPAPFSPLAEIPTGLVLALREHAKINPDLAVSTLIASTSAALRGGQIPDTGTAGFYGQAIQGIVDNFAKTTQPAVRQSALLLLKTLTDQLGPASIRPTAAAAQDALKNLQAVQIQLEVTSVEPVGVSNRAKIIGAVIGGLALAGVAVFVIARYDRRSR